MAAPTPTTRVAPNASNFRRLQNGAPSCYMTCSLDPDIAFWEISVKPAGGDGGELIDLSDQWTTRYRPMVPQAFITGTDAVVVAHYDPAVKLQIDAILNREATFTVTYPDGSVEAFFGVARSVEYDPLENGTDPRLTLTVGSSNYDWANDAEAGPALTSAAGT